MLQPKKSQSTHTIVRQDTGNARPVTTQPIHVAVADTCSVMRTGLIQTIEADPQMRVVASAAYHQQLLQSLHLNVVDVLVIDPVGMSDAPVSLVRDAARQFPCLNIVIFSSCVEFVSELMATGIRAYVAQREPDDQLLLAVRTAKAGQRFLSPLVQNYIDCYGLPTQKARLGPRELRCLMYMSQGLDNQAISIRMGIEVRTVENYVTKIRAKTCCDSRAQMVAWYRRLYPHT